ncbi:HupE/UreJ family protein [Nevskia sp.]|uniref:HupE/UreJ family protein n=1 Tax=Nevskia sp. TaxID=1929292 RepID=UPI0025E4D8E6|nr:HupE/UreJ family protein [Nevskia sp.]
MTALPLFRRRSRHRSAGIASRLIALLLLMLTSHLALAHPLGRNAFNREVAIVAAPDAVRIDYLLDLAEVPTLGAGAESDTDSNNSISDAEWAAYAASWAQALPAKLLLEAGDQRLGLTVIGQEWALSPGEAGLTTLRLLAHLSAPATWPADASVSLRYRDDHPERLGWREVSVSTVAGMKLLAADVPSISRTQSMTDFTQRPEGPPAVTQAVAELMAAPGEPGTGAVSLSITAKTGAAQPAASAQQATMWSFFKLGVHHIAIGWDHLIFLLGLVLLSGNLRRLAITITAFTVAHSITLGLASQGLVQPPGNWVEALIAATIAWVGFVALRTRTATHGPLLAFGFGLVHGFGFAGALAESLGEGSELNLLGLLSFNVGIECFQLLLVALVVPLLTVLGKRPWYHRLHLALASAVFLAGAWWFFERTLGNETWALAATMATGLAAIAGLQVLQRR